jgi:hypothetical protein
MSDTNTPDTDTPEDFPLVRGWTPDLQTQFLDQLALKGNVAASCKRVSLSREAAYRLRRRDPVFARGWAAAMVKAHDHCTEVLADRAIEGIEEPIYYRGELVGTRRKYDTRLLLAHIARLDKAAEDEAAQADAGRFDELLARIAGERLPRDLDSLDGVLPIERRLFAEKRAHKALDDHYAQTKDVDESPDEAELEARAIAANEAYRNGWAKADWHYNEWFHNACDYVDSATGWLDDAPAPDSADWAGADIFPKTVSTVSTGALAQALAMSAIAGDAAPPGSSGAMG